MSFGAIEIHHDIVHETADGRHFLVMHGDEFDVIVRYAKWLAFLGDRSYEFALWCKQPLNQVRRWLGFGYCPLRLSELRVKNAVDFIGEFEQAISQEAKRRNVDGVICGHIHHMTDRMIDGIRYLNCGDWVESCTAIAEDFDGKLSQIRWLPGSMETSPAVAAPAVPSFALEGIPSRAVSGRTAAVRPVRGSQYIASVE